jgi:hypothetical protein
MSGRMTKLQNALLASSVDIIETVPEVTGIVKDGAQNTRRIVKSGTGGMAEWMEDWEDSVIDAKAVKKFERANTLKARIRAAELDEVALNALPQVS